MPSHLRSSPQIPSLCSKFAAVDDNPAPHRSAPVNRGPEKRQTLGESLLTGSTPLIHYWYKTRRVRTIPENAVSLATTTGDVYFPGRTAPYGRRRVPPPAWIAWMVP